MAKQTTTNNPRPPQELDLNLESLRKEANNNLVASLREALKRFDEIDALENMLQRQMGHIATTAAAEAHTNGTNGSSRRIGRPPNVHEDEPRKKRAYRSPRVHGTVADMQARDRAALEILQKVGTGGITTSELIDELRQRKVFPKGHLTLRESARKLMRPLVEKKQVIQMTPRQQGIRGRHGEIKYFLVQPKPASVAKPARAAVTKKVPASATAARKNAHGVGDGLSMRKLVTNVLAVAPEGMNPGVITEILIKDGVPARRGNNPLNNHVNWALKALYERGLAGRRIVGGKPVYTLKRPTVSVTKHDDKT